MFRNFFFINSTNNLPKQLIIETKFWTNVFLRNFSVKDFEKTIKMERNVVLLSPQHYFSPADIKLKQAYYLSGTLGYLRAFEYGRKQMEIVMNRCINIFENNSNTYILKHLSGSNGSDIKNSNFGFKRISIAKPTSSCYVDIQAEKVLLGADPNGFREIDFLPQFKTLPKIAIGVPVTSKGLDRGAKPAILRYLIPSIIKTVSKKELKKPK